MVQPGTEMHEKVSLGALTTVPPHQKLQAHSTWVGSPAYLFGLTRDNDEEQTLLMQQLAMGEKKAEEEDIGEAHWTVSALMMFLAEFFNIGDNV